MRLPSNSGFVDSYCIGGLSPGMACFHQGRYPVSLRSGKLRVCAHLCLSFLWERKVMMLTRLALYSELMSCTYQVESRLPNYLGFFEFAHNARRRGEKLLQFLLRLFLDD
uniref:Uncharacterized protein n=1 Tax=Candidatus Kentrum eta TaxID=2126337 RepID=A0A450W0F9_9GAMM|nr:MAG: hypothetical protein BECKH772C_GA0070978_107142 [Candidatus Kentron sp. H]